MYGASSSRLCLGRDPVERAPGSGACASDDVPGPAEHGARRGAADEEDAGDEQRRADDGGSGLADQPGERPAEQDAEPAAAVAPEQAS